MDTLLFELFNSLAQTKSYTKTAAEFHISQPAVTHNIKKLESITNTTLIRRTNHGIDFTEAGVEYLSFVRQILSTMASAEMRMKNISIGEFGNLSIAVIPSSSDYMQSDIRYIRERANFNNVQIDIEVFEGPDLVNALTNGAYDLYYTTLDQVKHLENYDYITISPGSLGLFMHSSMYDAYSKKGFDALSELRFVSLPLYDAQLASPVVNTLNNNHFPIRMTTYYKRTESILLAISSNLGFSILPLAIENNYKYDNIVSVPLEFGENVFTYVLAWRKDNFSSTSQLFIKTIKNKYNS